MRAWRPPPAKHASRGSRSPRSRGSRCSRSTPSRSAERRGREPQAAPRRRGRPLRQRQDVDAALARRAAGSTSRRGRSRSSSPRADVVAGPLELGDPIETVFFGRPARRPSRDRAVERRALGLVGDRPAARDAGRDRRGKRSRARRGREHRLQRPRSPTSLARAASKRSTRGASACSSRSTASIRTPRTAGSAATCRSALRSCTSHGNVGRCVVTTQRPRHGGA